MESAKAHTPPATATVNSKTTEEDPKLQIDAAIASSSSTSSSSSGVVSTALPTQQQGNGDEAGDCPPHLFI